MEGKALGHIFDNASYIFDVPFTLIIQGGARGVDMIARAWAIGQGYPCETYAAKWTREDGTFNKAAGYQRNTIMVALATHVIVVWDGVSRGSKHTIDLARAKGLPLVVVTP